MKFEVKKLFKKKNLIWLLTVAILFTAAIYWQYSSQHPNYIQQTLEKINETYMNEVGEQQRFLTELEEEVGLDPLKARQLDAIQDIWVSLVQWRGALENRQLREAMQYEGEFLANLTAYEELEGQLVTFQGLEKEIAEAKHKWLNEHNLFHEDEEIPNSVHLLLKESSSFLFSLLGIILLLLFFGNTLIEEKEEKTWQLLKTQPISNWQIIGAKYICLVLTSILFILLVITVGIGIPYVLGDHTINFQYPQILTEGDHFTIISTSEYITRAAILFLGASIFAFSIALLLSRWAKNPFTVTMLSIFTVIMGYAITEMYVPLQTAANPFAQLRFSEILNQTPKPTDWLYPLAGVIWGTTLTSMTAFIPEGKMNILFTSDTKQPYKGGVTQKSHFTFWNISTFEWRKIKRQGLLLKVYAILALLVLFGYTVVSEQTYQRETAYIARLEQNLGWEKERLDNTKEAMQREVEYVEENYDKEVYERTLLRREKGHRHLKTWIDKLDAAISGYESKDWQSMHKYHLFKNRFYNNEFDTGYVADQSIKQEKLGRFTLEASIAEKEWMLERGVQPVFSGIYIPTTFYGGWENDTEAKEIWVEENTKVDNSGLFTLYIYFEKHLHFIPLALLLFLLGGGLATERGKKNTLNFLKTQPVSESKLFLGKLFNAKIVMVLSCIAVFFLVILVGSVFNRFGDWQYPILNYDSEAEVISSNYTGHKIENTNQGFHFINLGRYLLESTALLGFIAIFITSMAMLLSVFIQKKMSVLATTALIGAAGFALSQDLTEMAHLSPFTYLNIPKIINGEIATTLNNPGVNLQTGIAVLLTVTAALVLAGYFISGRRNTVSKSTQTTADLKSKSQ
ncbi:ABC transporter permease subunit [Proteinivorax tanatarense]|uniref:ABC transporter permease subunit n=1 Tax=Proteinivorax tanatarense TaxID=1260629 RepID=A0AAU7VKU2_9FIRM